MELLAPFTSVFFVLTVVVTGGLLAATPWLMPKDEYFAVTVPPAARADARLVGFRRRYAQAMAAITAVCALGLVAVLAVGPVDASSAALAWALGGAVLIPVVASFCLMLHYRRRVQDVKRAEGWRAEGRAAVAVVGEDDIPRPLSMAWDLLYIPVILGTLALVIATYPSMPDLIPMHADFSGTVNSWAPKNPAALFPVATQLFLAVVMVFCHWTILRSKRPTGVGAPVTTALAYGMFARASSVLLVATGLLLTTVMGVTFVLSDIGVITLGTVAVVILVAVAPVVAGSIVIAVVYGQAGSRLARRLGASGEETARLDADDDRYWKLGVFYVNPDDASLFLPERFGIGWTVNWGRPAAWGILVGLIVAVAAFMAGALALAG
ncbi:MAG: DUF1648 domain-containing protein [Eggerthellaceae bacterium]|nr:DUF1648 domain-containing protein [Eggerthellaceae bacterium]